MMFWYGNGMGGWGYALMTVSTVLFWALLLAGAVALVRHLGRGTRSAQGGPPPQPQNPEQVLAARFARGDIDAEEYQRRLDTLRGNARPDVTA
ncbi:SHOCT domain-containing protein [Actinokineospora sp. HUAS TT18]|uniref:SHOCT domain-containing protein n=1 Tax=Actinokineospora sp. HUAS TT18 TaxID=3447451 RepID=UPI003F523AFF